MANLNNPGSFGTAGIQMYSKLNYSFYCKFLLQIQSDINCDFSDIILLLTRLLIESTTNYPHPWTTTTTGILLI